MCAELVHTAQPRVNGMSLMEITKFKYQREKKKNLKPNRHLKHQSKLAKHSIRRLFNQ